MSKVEVKECFCFRNTCPSWLDDVVAAVQAVPNSILVGSVGNSLKRELEHLDEVVYRELEKRLCSPGLAKNNTVDIVMPTLPKTLIEIERGKLPRLELAIIKIVSTIVSKPDEYGYGCLIVPFNYIKLRLVGDLTPYQYVTERLLSLSKPLLDITDFRGNYLLREFCVIGYQDPRDIKPTD